MKFYLVALVVFLSSVVKSQDLLEGREWKLYRLQGNSIFTVPIDSLGRLKNSPLSGDSLTIFLAMAKKIEVNGHPAWMGGYLVTGNVEGKTHKILISAYGGFFYDQMAGIYYELPEDKVRDWNNYLTRCYVAIQD